MTTTLDDSPIPTDNLDLCDLIVRLGGKCASDGGSEPDPAGRLRPTHSLVVWTRWSTINGLPMGGPKRDDGSAWIACRSV